MDGASKFVKGDAVAGLIITTINIIGGICIGMLQEGMTLQAAAGRYSLLTVGDGLVAQIPALVLSTATGILVTRSAGEGNLGQDITRSLIRHYRPMWIGAGLLFSLAFVPGFPKLPFLALGSFLGAQGYWIYRENRQKGETKRASERSKKEAAGKGQAPPQGGQGRR
jgi:flagellar biosynthesis protein FlhA